MTDRIFTERVVVIRPRLVKGDYGGQVLTFDGAEEIPHPHPVSVQPVEQSEDNTSKSQLTRERLRLFTLPPNLLDVTENDRVRVEPWGMVFDVVGAPAQWRSTLAPHSEVILEAVHGARRN